MARDGGNDRIEGADRTGRGGDCAPASRRSVSLAKTMRPALLAMVQRKGLHERIDEGAGRGDVVVTAQNPIGHIGQWGDIHDERDYDVEIYLFEARREVLHQDKVKVAIAGEALSRLVARAAIPGAPGEDGAPTPVDDKMYAPAPPAPLRVVIFPTSAGSWSTFNNLIVPDITRQLITYVMSEPGLVLTYSFYADSAPGNFDSPKYWNGIKALKKPDVPAIVSATRERGGDVAIAVFHWSTTGMEDNIGAAQTRLYVIDAVSEKVFMQAGGGDQISKLADAAFVELGASRVALSSAGERESVN